MSIENEFERARPISGLGHGSITNALSGKIVRARRRRAKTTKSLDFVGERHTCGTAHLPFLRPLRFPNEDAVGRHCIRWPEMLTNC